MSKRKAVKVDHICDLRLDRPDMFLRIERRYWADGTSCLHIAKWCKQPKRGAFAPWSPPQYTQVPWEYAEQLGAAILDAAIQGDRGRDA